MHYKTFDTHKYIKSLQETGFNEQQAEVLVKSLLESRDFDLSILATRQQVTAVKSDLQKDIAEVKVEISEVKIEITQLDSKLSKEISATREQISEVKDEIKQSKIDMLKWIVPILFTNIAITIGIALKLL